MRYSRVTGCILGFLGVALLVTAVPVSAQPVQNFVGANAKGQLGLNIGELMANLAFVNTFMHVLILITLNFIQYLLQSDFFTNPGMMGSLNSIWRLSRDIMNLLFAIMLIGVALYTIVTADKKYVTDKLQTFVIAVILVNLSWFFPRVIIDVANVLTATIYTVPDYMTGGFQCETWDVNGNPVEPCKAIIGIKILPVNKPSQNAYCTVEPPNVPAADCHCSDIACYKTGSLAALRASGNAGAGHVMINGLVVNFVKILDMPKIAVAGANIAPGTIDRQGFMQALHILMIIAMSFIFQAAIVLPLVGLAVGLLARILIIWITTAFMPFAFLGYVINGKLGTNVFEFEHDIWKEFIAAAFMPALVAVPIAIGFIMLTAVTQIPAPTDLFPLSFDIPMFISVRTWWVLMWQVAAIVIVWTGTFAALSKSKIVGKFTEKIKGFGDSLMSSAKMLPLITPIPVPGGNLGGLVHTPRKIAQALRMSAEEGVSFTEAVKNRFNKGNQGDRGLTQEGLKNLINTQKQDTQAIVNAIKTIHSAPTDAERTNGIADLKRRLEMPGTNDAEAMKRLRDVIKSNQLSHDVQVKFNATIPEIEEIITKLQ